jgi:hypothetical protein
MGSTLPVLRRDVSESSTALVLAQSQLDELREDLRCLRQDEARRAWEGIVRDIHDQLEDNEGLKRMIRTFRTI